MQREGSANRTPAEKSMLVIKKKSMGFAARIVTKAQALRLEYYVEERSARDARKTRSMTTTISKFHQPGKDNYILHVRNLNIR